MNRMGFVRAVVVSLLCFILIGAFLLVTFLSVYDADEYVLFFYCFNILMCYIYYI